MNHQKNNAQANSYIDLAISELMAAMTANQAEGVTHKLAAVKLAIDHAQQAAFQLELLIDLGDTQPITPVEGESL